MKKTSAGLERTNAQSDNNQEADDSELIFYNALSHNTTPKKKENGNDLESILLSSIKTAGEGQQNRTEYDRPISSDEHNRMKESTHLPTIKPSGHKNNRTQPEPTLQQVLDGAVNSGIGPNNGQQQIDPTSKASTAEDIKNANAFIKKFEEDLNKTHLNESEIEKHKKAIDPHDSDNSVQHDKYPQSPYHQKIQDMMEYGNTTWSRIIGYGLFGLCVAASGIYHYSLTTTELNKIAILWGTAIGLVGAFAWATQKVLDPKNAKDKNQINKITYICKQIKDIKDQEGRDNPYIKRDSTSHYLSEMGKRSFLRSIIASAAITGTITAAYQAFNAVGTSSFAAEKHNLIYGMILVGTIFSLGLVHNFASRKFLSEEEKNRIQTNYAQ